MEIFTIERIERVLNSFKNGINHFKILLAEENLKVGEKRDNGRKLLLEFKDYSITGNDTTILNLPLLLSRISID